MTRSGHGGGPQGALRVILVPLLAVGLAAGAAGQVTVREQIQSAGIVEAAASGRLTVRTDRGDMLDLRLQRKDEQGVQLADGRLLGMTTEVRISGGFDIPQLKPGQVVRFEGLINGQGRTDGAVTAVTLIDAAGAPIGITPAAKPATAAEFARCMVVAPIKQAGKGRLVVQVPEDRPYARKTTFAFKVAEEATARLESSDPKRIDPGARVVSLEAIRLDTGDVVARKLVVESAAGGAVRERPDEKLENKYRGLADEPKREPRLIRSPHFAFLSDVSDREAKIILDKLERMAGLLERYFARKPAGVVEGFVVHDLSAFPPGAIAEPAGIAKIRERAGVCVNSRLGGQRRAMLYSCADHGVIQHESAHGFCHMMFGSTGPTWLAEGFAEMANYWQDGEQAVDIHPAVMAYLQRANPKRGLLEIAVPGQTPAGTWQDYAWRWALCHLLANNPNYDDRFRPLAIALMEERPGVSFESVYGPVAREISFEYDQFLRTVGNGYRADLAAWPWQARFRPLKDGAGRVGVTIKARAGWQGSGLRVERGATYALAATGTWRTAAAGEPVTADGGDGGRGRLTAAVFRDAEFVLQEPFAVGAEKTFVAAADGQLFLRCADDWTGLADNDGEIEVALRRIAD
ncbi:MAG: hypothetical protein ACK6CT_07095 [Planctomycetia bacterium]|jgi:hypothetical protein